MLQLQVGHEEQRMVEADFNVLSGQCTFEIFCAVKARLVDNAQRLGRRGREGGLGHASSSSAKAFYC